MSHQMNITDNQYYNFICGMQAGLKLKDMTLPNYSTSIVLTPIGVGGYGQIGIAIPQVLYDGSTVSGLIPVFTHDVDIEYSGFSCNITWDSSRLQITGISNGDFGIIGTHITYSLTSGSLKVRGLRDYTTKFKEPVILFYLAVNILDTNITKSNPIPINLNSGSGYDPDYTTLLTYVQNSQDSNYYLYYITPVKNVSGAIVSEIEDRQGTVGDNVAGGALASPSGVYIGTAYTPPGEHGVVGIVTNSNIHDNFPYNGFHTKVEIVDVSVLFTYLNVYSVGEWTLNTTITTNSSGYIELDIVGHRSESKIDSITVGYIEYIISNKDESYTIPLNNILSELYN